jgi:hypothetical protein
MSYTYAGVFGPTDFRIQNTTTKALVPPTAVAVYNVFTSTLSTLFADRTSATAGANPLPTGVAADNYGVDVNGNVRFWVAPGTYDVLVNGTTKYTVSVYPDPDDLQSLSAADVQSLKDWVTAQIAAAVALD